MNEHMQPSPVLTEQAHLPGIGELLGLSWQETKPRYVQMLALSVIPTGAVLLAILIGFLLYWSTQSSAVALVYAFIALVATLVLGLCAQAGNIAAALLPAHSRTFVQLLSEGKKHAGNLFVVSIIYAIGVTIGFVFLVFPGIWLALRYGMAFFIVVEEHVSAGEAFRKSAILTRGHIWPLCARALVYIFIYVLLAGIANYLWQNLSGGVYEGSESFNPISLLNVFLVPWYLLYAAGIYRALKLMNIGKVRGQL